jgi:hypothetical protein
MAVCCVAKFASKYGPGDESMAMAFRAAAAAFLTVDLLFHHIEESLDLLRVGVTLTALAGAFAANHFLYKAVEVPRSKIAPKVVEFARTYNLRDTPMRRKWNEERSRSPTPTPASPATTPTKKQEASGKSKGSKKAEVIVVRSGLPWIVAIWGIATFFQAWL